jgi:gluconolactonase
MGLAEGFDGAEGPVWVKDKDCFLFSDVPQITVFQVTGGGHRGQRLPQAERLHRKDPALGRARLERPTARPPGAAGPDAARCDRRVARLGEDAKFIILADKFEGSRLNSPSDGTYKSNGDLLPGAPPILPDSSYVRLERLVRRPRRSQCEGSEEDIAWLSRGSLSRRSGRA